MEDEFQEADVLWPDHHQRRRRRRDDGHGDHGHDQKQHGGKENDDNDDDDAAASGGDVARVLPGAGPTSAPVGIPVIRAPMAAEHQASGSWAARSYGGCTPPAAPFVPPHEVAAATARRCSEERAAFSVCVGHGRTLKGRDLRSVRTAVLRMTGFLET